MEGSRPVGVRLGGLAAFSRFFVASIHHHLVCLCLLQSWIGDSMYSIDISQWSAWHINLMYSCLV